MRNTLVDSVRKLVQDSKEPAKLAARADGQLASYVEWINSWGVPERATEIVGEWVPPVGTKNIRPRKGGSPGRRKRGATAEAVGHLDGTASGGTASHGRASIAKAGKLPRQDSCGKNGAGQDPGRDSEEIRQLLSSVAPVVAGSKEHQRARYGHS